MSVASEPEVPKTETNFISGITLDLVEMSLFDFETQDGKAIAPALLSVSVKPSLFDSEGRLEVTSFLVTIKLFEKKEVSESVEITTPPDENEESKTGGIFGYRVHLQNCIPKESGELIMAMGANAAGIAIQLVKSLISGQCRPNAVRWFEEAYKNTNVEVMIPK